jgi:hypothetical protein
MQTKLWKRLLISAVAVAALAAPSSALAAQRYASPAGLSTGSCLTPATACDLATAIHGDGIANSPSAGDEVIVEPGSYTNNAILIAGAPNMFIHGDFGGLRPVINEPTTGELQFSSGTVSYLDFESGTQNAVNMGGGTMERVFMKGGASGFFVCQCVGGTLRDSVLISTGSSAPLGIVSNGGTSSATYRNVTAIAADPAASGIELVHSGAGSVTVDAYNVIARDLGGGTDVKAFGPSATITFHHSNYGTKSQVTGGIVQDAPSDPHQTAAPLFTNAPAFDFSEALGSPTIDAGLTDPLNGDLDFAGDTRAIGGATDIGAYELNTQTGPVGQPPGTPGSFSGAGTGKKCKKQKKAAAAKKKKCGKKKSK